MIDITPQAMAADIFAHCQYLAAQIAAEAVKSDLLRGGRAEDELRRIATLVLLDWFLGRDKLPPSLIRKPKLEPTAEQDRKGAHDAEIENETADGTGDLVLRGGASG
jgi:hypothetical protein